MLAHMVYKIYMIRACWLRVYSYIMDMHSCMSAHTTMPSADMLHACIFYIPYGPTHSNHVHNIDLYSQPTCSEHVHFIYFIGPHAPIMFII